MRVITLASLIGQLAMLAVPVAAPGACDPFCYHLTYGHSGAWEPLWAANVDNLPPELQGTGLVRIVEAQDTWVAADATHSTLLEWDSAFYNPWSATNPELAEYPYEPEDYSGFLTFDTFNTFVWIYDVYDIPDWPEGAYAITRKRKDGDDFEVDTYFNCLDYNWQDAPSLGRPDGRFLQDIFTVALHECGHWLPLSDLWENGYSELTCGDCCMWGVRPEWEVRRSLGWGDKYGMCALYGGSGIGDLASFTATAGMGCIDLDWTMYSSKSYSFRLYASEAGRPYVLIHSLNATGSEFSFTDDRVIHGEPGTEYSYRLWVDDDFSSSSTATPYGGGTLACYSEVRCEELAQGMEVEWTTTYESPSLAGFDVYRRNGWNWLQGGEKYVPGTYTKINGSPLVAANVPSSYEFWDETASHGRQYSYLVVATDGTWDEERAGPAWNASWRPYLPQCEFAFASGQGGCPVLCPAGDATAGRAAPIRVCVTLRDSLGFPVEDVDDFFLSVSGSEGGSFRLCCEGQQQPVWSPWAMIPNAPTDENGEAWFDVLWGGGGDPSLELSAMLGEDGPIGEPLYTQVRCPDLDGDCDVDVADFSVFASLYGSADWRADFNCDGMVGIVDFSVFSSHFGHECTSKRTRPVPPELVAQLSSEGRDLDEFAASPAVPNPFHETTELLYNVPSEVTPVSIAVFDLAGRRVRTLVDKNERAGSHVAVWDGTDDRGRAVSSGVYFYRITGPGLDHTRKMLLLK